MGYSGRDMQLSSEQKRAEYAKMRRDIGDFSRRVLGIPLRAYQYDWAQYVLEMVREHRNETVIVEMARQSGKNQTSAHLEVSIMAQMGGRRGGEMVKAAPTRTPQIVNSKQRFRDIAQLAGQRIPGFTPKASEGYMYRWHNCGISFFSAAPEANVVGATASLLMELDEAQDFHQPKYDVDFAPMRASTGAPIVLYGTTWTDDTLLEQFKRDVLEGRIPGRVWRVDAGRVGDENSAYAAFVAQQVAQKGRQHPAIKTQYFLEPLENRGRLLNHAQLVGIIGEHDRQEKRVGERYVVAGLDFAGADESAGMVSSTGVSSRDSVALTIGVAEWQEIVKGVIVPSVRFLARYEWVNVHPLGLHSTLVDILQNRWKVDRVHIDGTGVGNTGALLLGKALDNNTGRRAITVTFDASWTTHTELVTQYLEMVNGSRMKDYRLPGVDVVRVAESGVPVSDDVDRHVWWQRGHARLEARESKKMRAYVADGEGHDDMLISELLCVDAAYKSAPLIQVEQKKRAGFG